MGMKRRTPLKPFKGAVLENGKWTGKPPQKKRQKGIRRVSSAKHARDLEYNKARKWFMARPENSTCPIAASGLIANEIGIKMPHFRATEQVHHMRGKIGSNYLDESTWLAISAVGHAWVHQNPAEARKRGWMLSR